MRSSRTSWAAAAALYWAPLNDQLVIEAVPLPGALQSLIFIRPIMRSSPQQSAAVRSSPQQSAAVCSPNYVYAQQYALAIIRNSPQQSAVIRSIRSAVLRSSPQH